MKKILILILAVILLAPVINAQSIGESCNLIGERRTITDINKIYCSIQATWQQQKALDSSCINNFECESDICQGSKCQDQDINTLFVYALSNLDISPDDLPPPPSTPGTSSSSSSSIISSYYKSSGACISQWDCSEWLPCIGGKKTRTCDDLMKCSRVDPIYDRPAETMLCEIPKEPTCNDGIKNQNEEGVDCGGPCEICKSCYDKEQNCHDGYCEEDIDCGGVCLPCIVEKAGHSLSFWIILITGILIALILILGFWYFKLSKDAGEISKELDKLSKPSESSIFRL